MAHLSDEQVLDMLEKLHQPYTDLGLQWCAGCSTARVMVDWPCASHVVLSQRKAKKVMN